MCVCPFAIQKNNTNPLFRINHNKISKIIKIIKIIKIMKSLPYLILFVKKHDKSSKIHKKKS